MNSRPILLLILILFFTGCEKFLETPAPNNQILTPAVFSSDNSANAAIIGIYSDMAVNSVMYGQLTVFSGLAADEFTVASSFSTSDFLQFQNNGLLSDNGSVGSVWSSIYPYIYDANAAIEGITASSGMSDAYRKQLNGEAHFIRAFCYFTLCNYFGDVPLVLTTNYLENQSLARTPKDIVMNLVVSDLQIAAQLLSADYGYSNGEKVRPNRMAAMALLARVYLYQSNWENALLESDSVINSGLYQMETDPGTVFLANSQEAIWQLLPVIPNYDTYEGQIFIPTDNTSFPNFILRPGLLNAFEPGDLRLQTWIDSSVVNGQAYYYPYKYKVGSGGGTTEYYMVLRYAEQYLIRAEALAMLDQVPAAVNDLNTIRSRANLPSVNSNISADSCLAAIANERRLEFFAEWGQRWMDLTRTHQADAVLGSLKPANWQSYDSLWPLPLSQLNANPHLIQNAGYR